MSLLRSSTWGPQQFLDKVVDMPVGVQRLVPLWFGLQITVEVPQFQYFDKVVDVPVEVVDVGSAAVLGQGR